MSATVTLPETEFSLEQAQGNTMSDMIGLNLHYRCAFDLHSRKGPVVWSDAVKLARRWIDQKERVEDLHKSWFFTGGRWRGRGRASAEVTTEFFEGAGDPNSPDHWAVRYEHPCAEAGADVRWWRTDVGFTRHVDEGGYRVSISNYHWIVSGYLGEDPATPPTSAPRLVRSFVESTCWEARAGSERLDTRPQTLAVGDGNVWAERLTDARRTCPLVYLADRHDGSPGQLDAGRLAKLLAGAAVVVEGGRDGLDDELRWLVPQEYRCWDGAVRVYLPDIDLQNRFGGKRHRFFSANRIDVLGPEAVEDMLIVGLARRSPILAQRDVTSPEDVVARKREVRVAQLRQDAAEGPNQELLKLFEEENQALTEKSRGLENQAKSYSSALDTLELEKEDLLAGVEEQKRAAKNLRSSLVTTEARVRQLERGLNAFRELQTLPGTVDEVVELARLVFPDRLRFTDRAVKSARDASINEKPNEMGQVWAVLRAMATVLHDLHFNRAEGADGNVVKEFESRTPFGLALTETGTTKDDNELMKLRQDIYNGVQIDITAHVKYGDRLPPKLLRIYYHPHHHENVLVIGHCGDHLDTAGTRRRS